jgi:hypothetical protein
MGDEDSVDGNDLGPRERTRERRVVPLSGVVGVFVEVGVFVDAGVAVEEGVLVGIKTAGFRSAGLSVAGAGVVGSATGAAGVSEDAAKTSGAGSTTVHRVRTFRVITKNKKRYTFLFDSDNRLWSGG